ncbi:MAG TPA: YggS family pyridoxal phosphate-dependent enzyme [Dissulfurispiraceae bacterium]|nr:YggS family pyridoxal phosphate-dependent enzyme [Dissulfurispiraceae bacterium]
MILTSASEVLRKMSHAAMRAGRQPDAVRLVAVSKSVPPERILEAMEAGLRVFGESRVQEARDKIALLREPSHEFSGVQWHLIGHLQKNKAKQAIRLFDLIHSVDSVELADELNRHAADHGKVQRVLVEVKLSEEDTKQGIVESDLDALIAHIRQCANLKLEGLMTMPPYDPDPEKARPYFHRLRELRAQAEKKGAVLPELSMGMSHDFGVAIEEGATMVRVGTAIFGGRS